MATPAKAQRSRRSGCLTLIVIIVAVIVVAAAVNGNKKGSSGGSTPAKASAPAAPFRATDAQMAAAVKTAVDSDDVAAQVSGPVKAQCLQQGGSASMSGKAGINCFVTYAVQEPSGLSAALELIDPTRGFFATAFGDPHVQAVYAQVRGPVTTVGGKNETGDYFSLACTRQAANQIDWSNVGASGLKQLCTYNAQISGLNN